MIIYFNDPRFQALRCDLTHLHVWHGSFIIVIWLFHMWDMTQSHVWHDCVSHVWHNSFTRVTRLIFFLIYLSHMCDSSVNASVTCVTRPIPANVVQHSYATRLIQMWDLNHSHVWHTNASYVWDIPTSPHSCECHAAFKCDIPHSNVRFDSFTCVTRECFICVRHMGWLRLVGSLKL